ncbi:MAG: 4-amino-4-deoxy-L-arabinose transferase, partial [Bacteroidota bacterium]
MMVGAWVLLNLWQSLFTELFHDEAYYWVFGQHLAWGYAEHAPLIAVLIRMGSEILGGEIGVRIFPVLLNGGAIYLMTLMAQPQRKWLWFLLLFSVFEVHIGGFFAAPDAPLIFFTTLFFFAYRKYL